MLARLNQTYIALFREYPFLLRAAIVTGAGQIAFALVNIYALPVYLVQDLHLPGVALGATSATFLVCETLLKFPMGRLSDRVGRKPLVVLGPLLICLNPVLVVAIPPRLWPLLFLLRAADGVGAAALWSPLFAMVGDEVADRSRAAAMSVMNTVYVAAVAAATVVGAFAAHLAGNDRFPFYMASALMLASAGTAYWGLPRTIAAHGSSPGADPDSPPDAQADDPAEAPPAVKFPLALVLLIGLLMSMGVLMLSNFIILYLRLDMGLSPLHVGVLVACVATPVLLLGLPLGHAADRWGTALAVRASLAASAFSMWLIPFCRTVPAFGAVAVLLIASHILGTPAWLALVSQLAPASRRGGLMGMVATAEGVGAVLGPLLAGWLWDFRHPYIFYGSAVSLTAAAAVAAVTLRAGQPRATAE